MTALKTDNYISTILFFFNFATAVNRNIQNALHVSARIIRDAVSTIIADRHLSTLRKLPTAVGFLLCQALPANWLSMGRHEPYEGAFLKLIID